jgi:hypothetical protein
MYCAASQVPKLVRSLLEGVAESRVKMLVIAVIARRVLVRFNHVALSSLMHFDAIDQFDIRDVVYAKHVRDQFPND